MTQPERHLGLTPMSDAPEVGPRIRERRERLGMSGMALAEEAKVDRGRLRALEAGDPSVRQSTIANVLAALDRMERRFQAPPLESEPVNGGHTVKVTLRGNFGVETTIEGLASDIDQLEELAGRLIDRMSAPSADRSPAPGITEAVGEAIRNRNPRDGNDQAVTRSKTTR